MEPGFTGRVILHIDFDSYYTQVEMKRLGIPRETPCAVQQWEGLIAVNYPARDRGVTRHMRVKEAKKICPDLVLVHVETIGDTSIAGESEGGSAAEAAGAGTSGGASSVGGREQEQHSRHTQKACLERYRRSTAEVLALLHHQASAAVIEKASIDEVYMDVTAMVDRALQASSAGAYGSNSASSSAGSARGGGHAGSCVDSFAWGSVVIGGPLDISSEFERRLAAGAGIACRLRSMLLSKLGYTASAGIATNKLLAKIGSAMYKPNIQTVIPPRSAHLIMQDLPLKKLRNFGGKLGELLEGLGCTTAGQVQQLPHATLVTHFGAERAVSIEQAVRGESREPVQERERPKSMLAAKSFNPTRDMSALEGWMRVLAQELAGRVATDEAEYRRRPKNLVVHYRGGTTRGAPERSKSCAMPRPGGATPGAEAIAAAAFKLFKSKCASKALPCSRLAISAADFTDLPASNGKTIAHFLMPRMAAGAAKDGGTEPWSGSPAGQQPPPTVAGAQSPQHQKQAPQPQQDRQRQGMAGSSISSLLECTQKRRKLVGSGTTQNDQQQEEQQQELGQEEQSAEVQGSAVPEMAPGARSATGPPATDVAAAHTSPAAAAAAAGGDAAAPPPAAAGPTESEGGLELAAVDVDEQWRILRDIRMMQMLSHGKPAASQTGGTTSVAAGSGGSRAGTAGRVCPVGQPPGKQRGISSFFSKQPKQGR